MEMKIFKRNSLSQLLILSIIVSFCNAQTNTTLQVGVILDVDSLVGRIGLTSLSLAASDFYSINRNYSTKLVLHVRDSKGQVTGAAASALSLLKDVQVDAIIGPQRSSQANFVIGLGDSAKVPIISFSATSPSLHPQTPFFVQTALNDAAQANVIAAMIKYFIWSQIVVIHEDSDYGNGIIPYLSNALQEVNARVTYRSVIPLLANDDFILKELYMMKTMQTRVFVVHLSTPLASKLFLKAKEAKMMSKGYAWIVTSALMDLFYSLDSNVVESMQGVLGVKPMIPRSRKLRSTNKRWKEKFLQDNPSISKVEMSLYGLWAYDTFWALAMAAEKIGIKGIISSLQSNTSFSNSTSDIFVTEISQTGPKLLGAMLETTFQGLGGNFRLIDGQRESSSFQILNVVGKRTSEIGIWTPSMRSLRARNKNLTSKQLTSVMFPGKSMYVPKGWEFPLSGKILKIGVPERAGFTEFVKVERDPQTNAPKVSGYYIDLFNAVMKELPYPVLYEYVPFETMNEGGYTNLTLQVFLENFDATVGDMTITAKRSEYVDFTLPFEQGGVTRTQKIQYDNPIGEWFFVEPLKGELWFTAIALFVLTGVAIWILEHRFNKDFRGSASEHGGLILYIPLMSLVFANRERIVTNLARLVIVVWIFVVLILNSTFTASLSARLTAWKLQQDDTNINVQIRNGDYVGCRQGSFIVDYLKNQGFDKSKIRTFKQAEDVHDALSKGSEKGGIKAFYSCTPYTELFLSKYCNKYMKVGSTSPTAGFAFAFPKGSPLVADVSRAIIKLTDNNKKKEIKRIYIKDSACNIDEPDASVAKGTRIGLTSFKVLFGITAGITAICLVVFLSSYLHQNRDFIQGIISNSSATTWSKIREIFKHFDQRDPKFFRSKDDENALPNNSAVHPHSQYHRSTVVPINLEEGMRPTENGDPNQSRL